MCDLVGLKVLALKRVRVGNVRLGKLPVGKWRYLEDGESLPVPPLKEPLPADRLPVRRVARKPLNLVNRTLEKLETNDAESL